MDSNQTIINNIIPVAPISRKSYIPLEFDLNSDTASVTKPCQTPDSDLFVEAIKLSIIDKNGKELSLLNSDIARDDIKIEIKSGDTDQNITTSPISLFTLADDTKSLGFFMSRRTRYTFTVSVGNFPATKVGQYPIRVNLTLVSYKLVG